MDWFLWAHKYNFFFKKTEGLNEYKCISVFEFSHALIVEEWASNV